MTIEDTSSKNEIVTGGYAVGATISITFPFDEPDTICVETDELGESARGEGGFGHTGVK